MPPTGVDLSYALPCQRITLDVWSSDFINFKFENKVIRTTLKNTVLDVKEIISERSVAIGGSLNPKALKLSYRHQEHEDHEELSIFLAQERENTRIRVEIIPEELGVRDIRPSLMNINLNLSNGKKILLRESPRVTIKSIKYTLAEDLSLQGIHDIISLQYNAGEELRNRDDLTLSELLQLDTAPIDDLNIYVRLQNDFIVRLSSPSESLIRINKMIACSETSINTIKRFIIDQYTGTSELDLSLVKIIYLGRVLGGDQKLMEIMNGDSAVSSLITLHFVINETEGPSQSSNINTGNTGLGALWNDLRRGNSLFEFLPVEPNPNFQADLERDRRLREQLALQASQPQEPIAGSSGSQQPVSQSQPQQESSAGERDYFETITEFDNSAPQLPDDIELIGKTFESAMVDGKEVFINQKDLSTAIYKVTLNTGDGPKVVELSSSQVIINNSDPSNPYLMVSPSGFTALRSLGIDMQPPKVVMSDQEYPEPTPTVPMTSTANHNTTYTQADHQNVQNHQPPGIQQAPEILPPFPFAQQQNRRRLGIRVNAVSITRFLTVFARLAYHLLKIWLFYTMILSQVSNTTQRNLCLVFLALYVITNGSIRNLLQGWQLLIPESYRNWITRYIQRPEERLREVLTNGSNFLMTGILDCLPTRQAHGVVERVDNVARYSIISMILFITSIFPGLHRNFLQERQNRLIRRQRELAEIRESVMREEQDRINEGTRLGTAGSDINTDTTVDSAPSESINTTEELIQTTDIATGVQRNHEN